MAVYEHCSTLPLSGKQSILTSELKKLKRLDDALSRHDAPSFLVLLSEYVCPGLLITTSCLLAYLIEEFCVRHPSDPRKRVSTIQFNTNQLFSKITVRFCLKLFGLPSEFVRAVLQDVSLLESEIPREFYVASSAIKTSTTRLSRLLRTSVDWMLYFFSLAHNF